MGAILSHAKPEGTGNESWVGSGKRNGIEKRGAAQTQPGISSRSSVRIPRSWGGAPRSAQIPPVFLALTHHHPYRDARGDREGLRRLVRGDRAPRAPPLRDCGRRWAANVAVVAHVAVDAAVVAVDVDVIGTLPVESEFLRPCCDYRVPAKSGTDLLSNRQRKPNGRDRSGLIMREEDRQRQLGTAIPLVPAKPSYIDNDGTAVRTAGPGGGAWGVGTTTRDISAIPGFVHIRDVGNVGEGSDGGADSDVCDNGDVGYRSRPESSALAFGASPPRKSTERIL
eukprot:gene16237-biopygen5884